MRSMPKHEGTCDALSEADRLHGTEGMDEPTAAETNEQSAQEECAALQLH